MHQLPGRIARLPIAPTSISESWGTITQRTLSFTNVVGQFVSGDKRSRKGSGQVRAQKRFFFRGFCGSEKAKNIRQFARDFSDTKKQTRTFLGRVDPFPGFGSTATPPTREKNAPIYRLD